MSIFPSSSPTISRTEVTLSLTWTTYSSPMSTSFSMPALATENAQERGSSWKTSEKLLTVVFKTSARFFTVPRLESRCSIWSSATLKMASIAMWRIRIPRMTTASRPPANPSSSQGLEGRMSHAEWSWSVVTYRKVHTATNSPSARRSAGSRADLNAKYFHSCACPPRGTSGPREARAFDQAPGSKGSGCAPSEQSAGTHPDLRRQ
mmetsp:Transcript_30081/g.82961  ORF Transcript_30081/g.82961 Transcript_30081/m.82961 type:complete len:206 (-) Transcript_30081:46-663(-)